MLFLNKDKETVACYKKENEKLRKDLNRTQRELHAVHDFKEKYAQLIQQVKQQVKHYNNLNCKYEQLIADCKSQLDSITHS